MLSRNNEDTMNGSKVTSCVRTRLEEDQHAAQSFKIVLTCFLC